MNQDANNALSPLQTTASESPERTASSRRNTEGVFSYPSPKGVLDCRGLPLPFGERTLVMGILNVTPDSFSDGGRYYGIERAIAHAFEMVAEGADLIDIGGESTRPGYTKVSVAEEAERVVPVIRALMEAGLPVPISVDTYKAEVARQALEAGAHIINDIWGLKGEPELASVAARYGCPIVLMHNRSHTDYDDLIAEVTDDLRGSIELALRAGIRRECIILDPGIGFGKTIEHNLQLMNRLHSVVGLGYPVLLGTSRKSMINKTLELPATDVIEGTAATVALGIAQGCGIVRVHDVKAMKRVADMTDAMVRV